MYKGEALVQDGDQNVKLKGGHELDLNASGKLKSRKFDEKSYEQSDLYHFSNLRSEYAAEANVDAAHLYYAGGPGWYGPGWYGIRRSRRIPGFRVTGSYTARLAGDSIHQASFMLLRFTIAGITRIAIATALELGRCRWAAHLCHTLLRRVRGTSFHPATSGGNFGVMGGGFHGGGTDKSWRRQ